MAYASSHRRPIWVIGSVGAILTIAGLSGFDEIVADWSASPQLGESVLSSGTSLLDLLALKEASNFLLGLLVVVMAAILLGFRQTRRFGRPLLYVGGVQFLATVIADLSKPQFGRLRPYEALADPRLGDTWFAGANSFPSGHTAFYAGLFFPLILILPRWTLLWLIPPIFVAIDRVVEHDHYLSDVSASITLAAVIAIALSYASRNRASPERPG